MPGGKGECEDWPEAGVEAGGRGDGVDDEQGVGGHAELWEGSAEDGCDGGTGKAPAVDVFGAESAEAVGGLPAAGVQPRLCGLMEHAQGRGAVGTAEPSAVGADNGCLKARMVEAEPDYVAVEEGLEASVEDGAVEDEEDGASAEALTLEGIYDVEVPAVPEPGGVYRVAAGTAGTGGAIPGGGAAGEPLAEWACAGQGGEAGEFVAQAVVHRRGQR